MEIGHYYTYQKLALVRRYLCRPVFDGKEMYEHRTSLQVIGLGKSQTLWAVYRDLEAIFLYKVICKCERCYVFEEVQKTPTSFAMPEPMMNGVLKILQATGLKPYTSTSISNPADGSVTTTWMCAV